MTRPRSQLVCVEQTPYYHVISRCVRRSFLCGHDTYTGQDYNHRRQYIEDRIHFLSNLFAIDITSYAVMSNHYHMVIKLCPGQVDHWSDYEVCQRWMSLYKGTQLTQKFLTHEPLTAHQISLVKQIIAIWRKRLSSISWFMKCLNEPIARMANQEDGCKGHFWEARYKSQSLKTQQALLSCMAYVDLNPIRAGMAYTLASSEHTSIKLRLAAKSETLTQPKYRGIDELLEGLVHEKSIMPFRDQTSDTSCAIPYRWDDYLILLQETGNLVRDNKQGLVHTKMSPILARMDLRMSTWLAYVKQFEYYHPKYFNHQDSRFNHKDNHFTLDGR